ncbi:hypothetical protein B0H13DRAFT_1862825 [Mycena leptocephala]|nr:hypothetical protein B0H13DRAFT_1862825 [Mycena leptocephala]
MRWMHQKDSDVEDEAAVSNVDRGQEGMNNGSRIGAGYLYEHMLRHILEVVRRFEGLRRARGDFDELWPIAPGRVSRSQRSEEGFVAGVFNAYSSCQILPRGFCGISRSHTEVVSNEVGIPLPLPDVGGQETARCTPPPLPQLGPNVLTHGRYPSSDGAQIETWQSLSEAGLSDAIKVPPIPPHFTRYRNSPFSSRLSTYKRARSRRVAGIPRFDPIALGIPTVPAIVRRTARVCSSAALDAGQQPGFPKKFGAGRQLCRLCWHALLQRPRGSRQSPRGTPSRGSSHASTSETLRPRNPRHHPLLALAPPAPRPRPPHPLPAAPQYASETRSSDVHMPHGEDAWGLAQVGRDRSTGMNATRGLVHEIQGLVERHRGARPNRERAYGPRQWGNAQISEAAIMIRLKSQLQSTAMNSFMTLQFDWGRAPPLIDPACLSFFLFGTGAPAADGGIT